MKPIELTDNFRSWAYDTVRIMLGSSKSQFHELVDWGSGENNLVQIPVSTECHQPNPLMGIQNDFPFLLLSNTDEPGFKETEETLRFNFDVISAIGWILGGYEELASQKRDKFGRWSEENSLLSKSGFSKRLVINDWIKTMKSFLKKKGISLNSYWPEGKTFAIVLSHDVDNPFYLPWPHFCELVKALFKGEVVNFKHSLMKLAGSAVIRVADGFFSPSGFTRMIEEENRIGVRSSIFVSGLSKSNSYRKFNDPIYDINNPRLKSSTDMANKMGFPIGVHPSSETAPHAERYLEQIKYIESTIGKNIMSLRHHYWNISRGLAADALAAMSEVGIEVDSSISFYNGQNFRRSIALPFQPFHPLQDKPIPITEIPPTFMDAWLSASNPKSSLIQHLKYVEEMDGLAVLNWHANRFNNRYFSAQGAAYLETIAEYAGRDNVWITNMEEVWHWWRSRTSSLE